MTIYCTRAVWRWWLLTGWPPLIGLVGNERFISVACLLLLLSMVIADPPLGVFLPWCASTPAKHFFIDFFFYCPVSHVHISDEAVTFFDTLPLSLSLSLSPGHPRA